MSSLSVGQSGATGNLYSNVPLNPATPVNKMELSAMDSAKTALATLAQNTASGLTANGQPQQATEANTHLLASHVEQVAQARASGDVTTAQKITRDDRKELSHSHNHSDSDSDSDSDEEPMPLFYSANHGVLDTSPPPGQWFNVKV